MELLYNDSAGAESKPAYAVLPSLRDAIIPSHGLKIKCPFRPLDFLRSWYNDSVTQNPSQLTLSCHHFVMHYTEPWLENQMSFQAA